MDGGKQALCTTYFECMVESRLSVLFSFLIKNLNGLYYVYTTETKLLGTNHFYISKFIILNDAMFVLQVKITAPSPPFHCKYSQVTIQ